MSGGWSLPDPPDPPDETERAGNSKPADMPDAGSAPAETREPRPAFATMQASLETLSVLVRRETEEMRAEAAGLADGKLLVSYWGLITKTHIQTYVSGAVTIAAAVAGLSLQNGKNDCAESERAGSTGATSRKITSGGEQSAKASEIGRAIFSATGGGKDFPGAAAFKESKPAAATHPSRLMAGDGPDCFQSEERATWPLFFVLENILLAGLILRVFLERCRPPHLAAIFPAGRRSPPRSSGGSSRSLRLMILAAVLFARGRGEVGACQELDRPARFTGTGAVSPYTICEEASSWRPWCQEGRPHTGRREAGESVPTCMSKPRVSTNHGWQCLTAMGSLGIALLALIVMPGDAAGPRGEPQKEAVGDDGNRLGANGPVRDREPGGARVLQSGPASRVEVPTLWQWLFRLIDCALLSRSATQILRFTIQFLVRSAARFNRGITTQKLNGTMIVLASSALLAVEGCAAFANPATDLLPPHSQSYPVTCRFGCSVSSWGGRVGENGPHSNRHSRLTKDVLGPLSWQGELPADSQRAWNIAVRQAWLHRTRTVATPTRGQLGLILLDMLQFIVWLLWKTMCNPPPLGRQWRDSETPEVRAGPRA